MCFLGIFICACRENNPKGRRFEYVRRIFHSQGTPVLLIL
jgi:hypothetical protein